MRKAGIAVALMSAGLAALSAGSARAAGEPALLRAAEAGDTARVGELLGSGVDANVRDERGETALVRAARAGSLGVVRALVAARADVDASDRDGLTPLIAATRLGHSAVLDALLDAGADPDMRHRALGTALDVAERAGRFDLAALLRARGARGSGRSVGDLVCVRPWGGEGFCGTITAVRGPRLRLRVTRLVGCAAGCAPLPACTGDRPVGGGTSGALAIGRDVWVESSCLTNTNVKVDER